MPRAAAALRADAEALEEAHPARREPRHAQAAVDELAADVVDAAERSPGLGHDLAVEELGEPHQDPGSRPIRRAQRTSPRFRRSSADVRLKLHARRHGLDVAPGDVDGVARESGRQPAEAPAGAPRVAADEDLDDLRGIAVEPGDLEIVDLAAVEPFAVDELVVEDAERDVDLRRPCSSLTSVREQHQRDGRDRDREDEDEVDHPEDIRDPAVDVGAHVGAVVRDQEDRQVGQRQRDDREDD